MTAIALTTQSMSNAFSSYENRAEKVQDIVATILNYVSGVVSIGIKELVEAEFDKEISKKNIKMRHAMKTFLDAESSIDNLKATLEERLEDASIGYLDPDLKIWEESKGIIDQLKSASNDTREAIDYIQGSNINRVILTETISILSMMGSLIDSLAVKVGDVAELMSIHDSLMMPTLEKTGIAELDALNA